MLQLPLILAGLISMSSLWAHTSAGNDNFQEPPSCGRDLFEEPLHPEPNRNMAQFLIGLINTVDPGVQPWKRARGEFEITLQPPVSFAPLTLFFVSDLAAKCYQHQFEKRSAVVALSNEELEGWFRAMIQKAAGEPERTVTPQLALEVLNERVLKKQIRRETLKARSDLIRLAWQTYESETRARALADVKDTIRTLNVGATPAQMQESYKYLLAQLRKLPTQPKRASNGGLLRQVSSASVDEAFLQQLSERVGVDVTSSAALLLEANYADPDEELPIHSLVEGALFDMSAKDFPFTNLGEMQAVASGQDEGTEDQNEALQNFFESLAQKGYSPLAARWALAEAAKARARESF